MTPVRILPSMPRLVDNLDGLKLNTISMLLGIDLRKSPWRSWTKINEMELSWQRISIMKASKALCMHVKTSGIAAVRALPATQVRSMKRTSGATMWRTYLVPFTDGKKQGRGSSAPSRQSPWRRKVREMIKSMEKMITLAIIDQTWKEHLREMDDLKQSVQNAVYEQKDPLIIYKFEGFELFKGISWVKSTKNVRAFLMKSHIPVQDPRSGTRGQITAYSQTGL